MDRKNGSGQSEVIEEATKKSARPYPGLFLRALLFSNKDVSVFKTIGAFVYMKSNDKEDVHQYLLGLAEKSNVELFVNADMVKSNNKEWLNGTFNAGDIVSDTSGPYEKLVFTLMKEPSWIAPYLTDYQTAYLSGGAGFGFPDCGENSLLNLYRVIFAKKDLTIDLELLEKIKTSERVIRFFRTYSDLKVLRKPAARNAWAEVTSNIKNLCEIEGAYMDRARYNERWRKPEEHCEMNEGFHNMDRFIQELQGVSFVQLIEQINSLRENNFNIKKKLNDDGLGVVTINTEDRGSYFWHFEKGHFIFECVKANNQSNFLKNLLEMSQPEKDLISLLPTTSDKMKVLFQQTDNKYLTLLGKLTNDDHIVMFASRSFEKNNLINPLKLLERISEDAHTRLRANVFETSQNGDKAVLPYINALAKLNKISLLETPTRNGMTALHYAARNCGDDVVAALLSNMNIDSINAKDIVGNTALFYAVNNKKNKIVELLLSKMSQESINAKNNEGDTALHIATSHAPMVREWDILFKLVLERMSFAAVVDKNKKGNSVFDLIANKIKDPVKVAEVFSPTIGIDKLIDIVFRPGAKRVSEDFMKFLNPQIKVQIAAKKFPTDQFRQQDWVECDLSDLDLSNINFTGIDLTGVNFTGSILNGANFTDALIELAKFDGASLINADFTDTGITNAQLDSIVSPRSLVLGLKEHQQAMAIPDQVLIDGHMR